MFGVVRWIKSRPRREPFHCAARRIERQGLGNVSSRIVDLIVFQDLYEQGSSRRTRPTRIAAARRGLAPLLGGISSCRRSAVCGFQPASRQQSQRPAPLSDSPRRTHGRAAPWVHAPRDCAPLLSGHRDGQWRTTPRRFDSHVDPQVPPLIGCRWCSERAEPSRRHLQTVRD